MKRLIFLISLLMAGQVSANNKTVVIGDSTYFNFTYTSAIDSAQLILIRGTVKDTISLMPITGSSHKIVDWEDVLDMVDSAGNYNVWIEPYSSGAIIDTVLGDCLVELAARDVNVVQISGDGTAADNEELMFDGTGYAGGTTKLVVAVGWMNEGVITDIATSTSAITEFWEADTAIVESGMAAMLKNMSAAVIVAKGDVDSSTAGTKWIISHGLTQGNDYWNENMILFFTGTAAGQVARIVDFVAVNDSVTFLPVLSVAPAVGDSFMILGILGEIKPDVNVASADANAFGAADFESAFYETVADSVLKDSLSFQGEAGSLTPGSIWDYSLTDWADSSDDEAGKLLITASNAAGSGANTCSLWVYDTGNTVMVSDIKVRANNTSGANQGMDRTNVTGIAVLNLDDGDYNLVIPMNSGYIQTTNPQPFTVSGATNDTIDVTWFSPSDPEGDLCTVYNYVKDANDNGIAGVVITATIPTNFWPITYEGQAIKATYTAKTNTTGLWQLPVFPSGLLLTVDGDSASFYQFTASGQLFGPMGIKVTVPTDSTTFFMMPDDEQ